MSAESTEVPFFFKRVDGMSEEYVRYARKLVSLSYQTLCSRQLHVLSVPAYRPEADSEHRALGAERARLAQLATMLASDVLPELGLDPEGLRIEAESDLASGRKLRLTTVPIDSWVDGIVYRHLLSLVLAGQLSALLGSNFIPYANWAQSLYFAECLRHWPDELGSPHLAALLSAADDDRPLVESSLKKWWSQAPDCFGASGSENESAYIGLGLKTRTNDSCRELFWALAEEELARVGVWQVVAGFRDKSAGGS